MPFDESKGNRSILEEHRKLALPYSKSKNISQECRALVKKALTFDYKTRPKIHEIILQPFFRQGRAPRQHAVQSNTSLQATDPPTGSRTSAKGNSSSAPHESTSCDAKIPTGGVPILGKRSVS